MKTRMLAGLSIASMLLGGMGIGYVGPLEPSRGWNGFLGESVKNKPRHTNRLRCSHNAKLKRRKQS